MKAKLIFYFVASVAGATLAIYQHSMQTEAYIPKGPSVMMAESYVTYPELVIEDHRVKEIGLDTCKLPSEIQIFAQQKCKQYNIPFSMFLAFCESESSFINYGDVKDGTGISTGYMQIRECNWNRYDGLDVHDTFDNIEIGIRMISELKEKYMEADKIVMAYKGGESAMLKWVEQGIRLDACDQLEERMIFWEKEINNVKQLMED